MKFEQSSSSSSDSEKELYDQLGIEIEPLTKKLNEIDDRIAMIIKNKFALGHDQESLKS